MTQKAFKFEFREAQNRNNYIVGESNINAIKWIDKYPSWKNSGLIIEGPKSSGKSHLVRVWQKKSDCDIFNSYHINKEEINLKNSQNIAIENFEYVENYEFFLHLINYKKENNLKYLLTTGPNFISTNILLKDLKSRLLELPKVQISLPSDDILKKLIIKLLNDKGILIGEKLIEYIINRVERSYESVNMLVEELNQISLDKKKKVTLSLIREVISKQNAGYGK